MKVLEKATTPDGVKIQIEDWRMNYSFINTLNIVAYPFATMSQDDKPFGLRKGKTFRLNISKFKNNDEVFKVFEKLKNGGSIIEDFSNMFEPLAEGVDPLQYII